MPASVITLVLMLIGIGAALCAGTAALMAWSLVHPPRMTDAKALWLLRRLSPADLGLGFEDLRFQIRDQDGRPLNLAAWWIPAERAADRCAVLIHGYADAKVGAIAWAPVWHALGFNLLVPDLRGHGESGGFVSTGGYLERHDVSALLEELRARLPDQTRQIVLFGVSLGAAVAAATATMRSDINAVVMESPYGDFPNAAMLHMDRLGAPGRALQRLAIRLAQWLTDASYASARPIDLIPRLPCPVLLILSGNDSFLSCDDRLALEQAVAAHAPDAGPAELWIVPGVEHLMALSANPDAYRRRIGQFLDSAFSSVPNQQARQPA